MRWLEEGVPDARARARQQRARLGGCAHARWSHGRGAVAFWAARAPRALGHG
jgi:hypothetical protein